MNRDTEVWTPWPVSWSAIWIGALVALAVGMIIGLIGTRGRRARRVALCRLGQAPADRHRVRRGGVVLRLRGRRMVGRAVAGIERAETAILHAGIVWALGIPLLIAMAAFGASGLGGGWYGALAGTPAWVAAVPPADPEIARAMRNTALASVVALLIGLMGAVIGGWMASGEPMTLTYYRRRDLTTRRVAAKA